MAGVPAGNTGASPPAPEQERTLDCPMPGWQTEPTAPDPRCAPTETVRAARPCPFFPSSPTRVTIRGPGSCQLAYPNDSIPGICPKSQRDTDHCPATRRPGPRWPRESRPIREVAPIGLQRAWHSVCAVLHANAIWLPKEPVTRLSLRAGPPRQPGAAWGAPRHAGQTGKPASQYALQQSSPAHWPRQNRVPDPL